MIIVNIASENTDDIMCHVLQNALQTQGYISNICNIYAKNVKPESEHEAALAKPKLRNVVKK